ncbi:MAG: hypothetical protein COZ85_01370 [Candidatus Moranbacteria bacterium CG_4_8_14_3_um_filter_34_16]|nr:MAG: hypothetical protein COT31_03825 [Candidatus Moranbacteria bacterium CG08_land_8_20_14_0_20_34_16]PIW95169.1 MAG: hypothetical protein COZ85_01370 [Candidatus Moranbacteria bacterium CG_4_8_14_3_um_filter_34_16]PJA89505.1 MAG: hypothetical protein CO138_00080 [Candidatus Moranbacteria bacterium CG_4_9_14_3_um_filter_33_15]
MPKIKRSFFEKITGARKIDENENYLEERYTPSSSNIYTENIEMETTEEIPRIPIAQEDNSFSRSQQQEDGEGQLTIDVYQTENDIIVKSTIAGVKPEDLDVSISNDMLTIHGERRQEEEISEKNYYYQECYWGGFSRSVILPVDVLADKIEASMKNGILTIKMPKADNSRSKKIQVRGF